MSNFVFEVRSKPQLHSRPATIVNNGDFVASFGFSSKTRPTFPGYLSPSPDSLSPRCGSESSSMSPPSPHISDSCGHLTPPHEPMAGTCDSYSKEEVFDMVSSKQLTKSRTKTILEESILVLTERLLHGRSIDRIEGTITIALSGDKEPIFVQLSKLFNEGRQQSSFDLGLADSVKIKPDVRARDCPNSVSSEDWLHGLSPDGCLRADERQSVSSPAMHSPRAATLDEKELNKSTSDNEEARVPDLRTVLDKNVAFGDSETNSDFEHVSKRREVEEKNRAFVEVNDCHTEDEDCTESALVIDIPSDEMEVESSTAKGMRTGNRNEKETVMESETDDSGLEVSSSSDSLSDEHEDSDESSMVKPVAVNGLEDAPGDSSLSREPLAPSKSHSLVSKLSHGLECKQCHQSLPDPESVASHAFDAHGLYCCTYCFKTFTAKNNLKRHVRLHTGQRPYKCTQCHEKFARRDDLKGHMLRHDYNKPYRCSICHKGYTDKACVKNHMAREHGSRRLIVCPQCGESFDNDDAFSDHKRTHPELNKFACKECSFIGTNKLMTMKHMLIHSHKLFSCKSCNAYFPDPFNYTSHLRTHKATPTFTEYKCCFCDLVLPSYEQFVRHEYSHAQGKTYSCGVCDKQFNSKASVQEHSLCHKVEEAAKPEQQPEAEDAVLHSNMIASNSESDEKPSISIPQIVLNEPEDQLTDDSACDGVLDLSMKKPSSDSSENHGQNLSSGVSPSSMSCGHTDYSAPRDGCTTGSPTSGRGDATAHQVLPLFSTVERTEEAVYRPVFTTEDIVARAEQPRESIPNFLSVPMEPESRPRSTEAKPSADSFNKASLLFRSLSVHHGHHRYDPYKHKMADFTQKFLAARGPHSALLKKGRTVLKPVVPEVANLARMEANRIPSIAPMWSQQHDRLPMGDKTEVRRQFDNKMPSLTNYGEEQEQCETSQLPTFIKSEPFFDTGSCGIEVSSSTHPRRDGGAGVNEACSAHRDKAHVCEQCKEEFSSFPELENHSVNMHKRYLCEHCGKSFSARPNRDRHVRYHTGERPYKCDLCDQAFFRGDDLKYHRTTRHPTAKPFVCGCCSATFTWKKDLERHIRQSKCKL